MATDYATIQCPWCGAPAYRGPEGGAVCPSCRRVWNDSLLQLRRL